MKNLVKTWGGGRFYNSISYLITALLLAATVIVAVSCGDATVSEEVEPGPVFDPKTAYPIEITVSRGEFLEDGYYMVAPFSEGSAVPKVTASVDKAKKGDKVTVNISDIPEGLMLDGGHSVVQAQDGSRPALDKTNKFTMPAGPVSVNIVFMSIEDFLKSSVAYDKTLYTIDIEAGEIEAPFPNNSEPYRESYANYGDPDNPQYWGASVASSGYSASDPTVTQITAIGNNSGADASWNYKDGNSSLRNVGEGDSSYNAFYVEAKVLPQILNVFPSLSDIPATLQALHLIEGDDAGKTVTEAYNEAKASGAKSYFFAVKVREPAVNAFLYALNISTVIHEFQFKDPLQGGDGASWGDANNPWENTYGTVTFGSTGEEIKAPFEEVVSSAMEFNVTAEAEDGNAMVRIGTQAYKAGSNENTITYNGLTDTSVTFNVSVQAENAACTKVYTVIITKEPAKYTKGAEGGATYFVTEEDKTYEVHAFYIGSKETVSASGQKEAELKFLNDGSKPATAEVLIVAGGGAGGGAGGIGGGGGGGVIHYSSINLTNVGTKSGSNGLIYPVKIGAGGAVSTNNGQASGNGGASVFGEGANRLEAPGGGGGGAFPNADGRAFKGADGGNGGGGGTGWNHGGVRWDWRPQDDLNGQLWYGVPLGRALVTPFIFSKNHDGSSIQSQQPDNIKTYPATNSSFTTIGYNKNIEDTSDLDDVQTAYQQSKSGNVEDYKKQHAGHAFGNPGGWSSGIADASGGSGAGTDAWMHTTAGRNSSNSGGQGIMFNTSGQWRWYSMGGPGGYRSWMPFSGGNSAGAAQTGNGGGAGFPGGSGTVLVRWEINPSQVITQ